MHAINEDHSLVHYRDFNFTEYYRTWVNEPGYPILYVDVDHSTGDIALSQVIYDTSYSLYSVMMFSNNVEYLFSIFLSDTILPKPNSDTYRPYLSNSHNVFYED